MTRLTTLLQAVSRSRQRRISRAVEHLSLDGRVIQVRFDPALTVWRGQLYSRAHRGQPVHAGCHIRRREIILDSALLRNPVELNRILIHELFHFTWVRVGNPSRASYTALLRTERERNARGELGWSAEHRKAALPPAAEPDHRKWRDYTCESFCDTAAWLFSGNPSHNEYTLAETHRTRRKRWFQETFPAARFPI